MRPLLNPSRYIINQYVFNHCVMYQCAFNYKQLCSALFCLLEILCDFNHQLLVTDPRNCRFINVIRILECIVKELFKAKSTFQAWLLLGLMNLYCEQYFTGVQVSTELVGSMQSVVLSPEIHPMLHHLKVPNSSRNAIFYNWPLPCLRY